MSPVITLRRCLVAGGAALAVALTVGAGIVTAPALAPAEHADLQRVDLDLPVGPPAPLDGTDAGLITAPAGAELADAADLTAQQPAPAPASRTVHAAPRTVTVTAPAPAPVPVVDEDPPGTQLPDEVIGSYRCPDPTQVIVAIGPDGTVCGAPDDTVQG